MPFAGAIAVAVEIEILVTLVSATIDHHGREVINRGRNVHVIINVAAPLRGRLRGRYPSIEGDQVGVALLLACFFFG